MHKHHLCSTDTNLLSKRNYLLSILSINELAKWCGCEVQQGVNIEAKMTKKRITTNSSNKNMPRVKLWF